MFPLAHAFDCSTLSSKNDCLALQQTNASLIPDLLYSNNDFPNHTIIQNYNDAKAIVPVQKYSSGNLKDAWLEVPYVYPSIMYNNQLLVENFHFRGAYDFSYTVPSTYTNSKKRDGSTCKIKYYYDSKSSNIKIYADGSLISTNLNNQFSISKKTFFKLESTYSVTIKEKYYEWNYKGDGYWSCSYEYTNFNTDTLTLSKNFTLYPYVETQKPIYTFVYYYENNYWGNLSDYSINQKLVIGDSYLKKEKYAFYASFIEPYEYLQLYAMDNNFTSSQGLAYDNDLLITHLKDNCSIVYYDFFNWHNTSCVDNAVLISVDKIEMIEKMQDWNFIFMLGVFILINVVLYYVIRRHWIYI